MRLVKEDILNIDRYLKDKGIKFLDVRYELIDHLVSEYEAMENYPDLESFLIKRVAWCKKVAEERRKAIHWKYQKALQLRLLGFLKQPLFYFLLVLWAIFLILINAKISSTFYYGMLMSILITIVVFQVGFFFYMKRKDGFKKKVLSYDTIFNIYILPQLFLHLPTFMNPILKDNPFWCGLFFTIAYIVNIAALLVTMTKRKQIIEEYTFLKKYFS
ncbi:hypothetical protein [uncultured Maribacter sp.]|uniref:hypothetical protein n=1 Tax=uncultured Maribacter sp. TaxID=431308 RepID=UPI00261D32EC|nr:hypothetical protein [uncultured Maribacter sp.]